MARKFQTIIHLTIYLITIGVSKMNNALKNEMRELTVEEIEVVAGGLPSIGEIKVAVKQIGKGLQMIGEAIWDLF
jgi:hypothetical protein